MGDVVATMHGDGPCEGSGTEQDPCVLDGIETEQCSPYQEWDEGLDECFCENGSDEWDCWIDPNPGGPDPGEPIPSGDVGGGGSDGSHEPLAPDEAAEDWFLKLPEVNCDGPPLSDPAKEAARKAWCQSVPLDATDLAKVNAALDRIQGAGGICVALASLGRELLNTQMLKKFAPFAKNPSAATNTTQRGITIHAIWLGEREMPHPESPDPRSLQFTLAHELDHLIPWAEGGQGSGHIDPLNLYTRNSERCGGGGAA
jgi:hypothetical protein